MDRTDRVDPAHIELRLLERQQEHAQRVENGWQGDGSVLRWPIPANGSVSSTRTQPGTATAKAIVLPPLTTRQCRSSRSLSCRLRDC